jgi:hypothetical protein
MSNCIKTKNTVAAAVVKICVAKTIYAKLRAKQTGGKE